MKNSQKFIIAQINNLVTKIQGLHVLYEYFVPTETHLIDVQLLEKMHNLEVLVNYEMQMLHDFIIQFPMEGLVFVDKDSLCQVENPCYEMGNLHHSSTTYKDFKMANTTTIKYNCNISIENNTMLSDLAYAVAA